MGKDFIEYQNETGRVPYSAPALCFCLIQYAKNYINSKNKLTGIDSNLRDAVLVDAINYLGLQGGCDFALYTSDLYDNEVYDEEVSPECLLTVVQNHYAQYIFSGTMASSVQRNNHMNNLKEAINPNCGAFVLIDFINYIAKTNNYDKVFTLKDLSEKYEIQSHKMELQQLKKFLEKAANYSEQLASGKSIDEIYEQMAKEHHLKKISKRGVYHYTDEVKARVHQSKMYSWDAKDVENEIYAMSYAYGKDENPDKQAPETEIIKKKVKEMSKK